MRESRCSTLTTWCYLTTSWMLLHVCLTSALKLSRYADFLLAMCGCVGYVVWSLGHACLDNVVHVPTGKKKWLWIDCGCTCVYEIVCEFSCKGVENSTKYLNDLVTDIVVSAYATFLTDFSVIFKLKFVLVNDLGHREVV